MFFFHGSFWENVGVYGLFETLSNNYPELEDIRDIKPIYKVIATDLIGSNADISKRLLVGESEVEDIKAKYAASLLNDESLYIFRFAVTDYYSNFLNVYSRVPFEEWFPLDIDAYRTYQTVFLNFDIIEFTFFKEGNYYVIPAVSDPIDIVSTISPPRTFDFDIWELISAVVGVIAVIAAIVAIVFLFDPILAFLVRFFKGLFKLLKLLFIQIKKLAIFLFESIKAFIKAAISGIKAFGSGVVKLFKFIGIKIKDLWVFLWPKIKLVCAYLAIILDRIKQFFILLGRKISELFRRLIRR